MHTTNEWEERWDNLFWLHRIPRNTKQAKDVKEFINQAILDERKRISVILEETKKTVGDFSGQGFVSEDMKNFAKIALNEALQAINI